MHPSSTAPSAATASRHRATPMHSSSGNAMGASSRSMHSSRRDERTTSGPLTAERAMMEQIRSKLERAQLRLAHSQAKSTSRHGYNGNSAAPMSMEGMGIASSSAHHYHHHQSSSRHTHSHTHSRTHQSTKSHSHSHVHSRSQIQSQGQTLPEGGSYYFPPDYKSARAPVVKSVYLEDLSMVISADQRTPPVSTDARHVMKSSKTPSYYAPMDESRVSTRHHQHYEQSQTSKSHVRSERHAVHEMHQHHHHHHHSRSHRHEDREGSSVPAPPKTVRGVRSTARARQYDDEDDDDVPSARESFVSSAFAMHGGVLPLSAIKTSRDAPPPSSTSSYASYSKQPLGANGQPERSALKHRVESSSDDEEAEVVAAPPSSRVRFHEQLTTAAYSPVGKDGHAAPAYEHVEYAANNEDFQVMHESELFHMPVSMPYELASLVEEEHSDDSDDDGALEPVVNVKRTRAVADEPHADRKQELTNQELHTMAIPSSPQNRKSRARSMSNTSDKDLPPRRRRGSSAAQSPSSSNYIRKSLSTLEPPKSAINLAAMGFEMRPRRTSREKQFSQASGDLDVDAMSVSDGTRRSSITEMFAGSAVELSSSPIDVGISSYGTYDSFGTYDSPRVSQGSLHCSELMFEDDGSVPFDDDYAPYKYSSPVKEEEEKTTETPMAGELKLSPSSSNEYSDARAYPEEDEESERAIPASKSKQTQAAAAGFPSPDRTSDESSLSYSDEDVAPQPSRVPSKTEYNDFWQVTSTAAQPEPGPATRPTASARAPPPPPPPPQPQYHRSRHLAQSHSHVSSSQQSPRKPSQFSQSMMVPPTTSTSARNRPPPVSTHIRPSPATAHPSVSRPSANFSASTTGVPRAPATLDGSSYVPRHLRPKNQLTQLRKAMPPSISVLSGLASGPVTFELNVESFYEVTWQTGEFGFSFQRVYLEDENDAGTRRMFLRMLLNTERGTCASFKEVHVGDVLIEIGSTRVCDLRLDNHGGGVALTKFFTDLRNKTPLRLVFQRMDPMTWDGGVEL